MLKLRSQQGEKRSRKRSHSSRPAFALSHAPARSVTQEVEDKQIWLDNQSADFSHIWDLLPPPSQMLLFVTRTLSCWAMILEWTLPSHQALFSPGNHPCPYVCSPGSCHDNSLCVIRLLFVEWHLNDHFMDRWNTLTLIKKIYTERGSNSSL